MQMHARSGLAVVLGLMLLLAGGCASWDRHVFQSTEDRPTSVAVVDAAEGETLWQFDVPPNHRLTLDLANSGEVGAVYVSGRPATHLNWKLHQVESGALAAMGSRRVSGGRVELERRAVRIDVDYLEPSRRVRAPEPTMDDAPDLEDAADDEPADEAMADAGDEDDTDE